MYASNVLQKFWCNSDFYINLAIRSALAQLGYKGIYHMFEVVHNPSDAEFWVEALQSKYFGEAWKVGREDYDGILGNFQA